jgi:hypothetical protein
VLVAISIPIFSSQLEKSRDAVTLSNIRAAYAEAQSAYLTQSDDGTDVDYTAGDNGAATVVVKGVEAKGQKDGLDNVGNLPIPAASQTALETAMGGKAGKYDLTFTYDANGLVSVSAETSK